MATGLTASGAWQQAVGGYYPRTGQQRPGPGTARPGDYGQLRPQPTPTPGPWGPGPWQPPLPQPRPQPQPGPGTARPPDLDRRQRLAGPGGALRPQPGPGTAGLLSGSAPAATPGGFSSWDYGQRPVTTGYTGNPLDTGGGAGVIQNAYQQAQQNPITQQLQDYYQNAGRPSDLQKQVQDYYSQSLQTGGDYAAELTARTAAAERAALESASGQAAGMGRTGTSAAEARKIRAGAQAGQTQAMAQGRMAAAQQAASFEAALKNQEFAGAEAAAGWVQQQFAQGMTVAQMLQSLWQSATGNLGFKGFGGPVQKQVEVPAGFPGQPEEAANVAYWQAVERA